MDEAVIRQALEAGLTANEWKVLAAMFLGHLDIYDIQRVTGIQRLRVLAAVQNAQHIYMCSSNKTSKTLLVPVQDARADAGEWSTPPQRILSHLNGQLGIYTSNVARDIKLAKDLYILAYEKLNKDQAAAIQLVIDCIDTNKDLLKKATAPMPYLVALFKAYIRSIPEMPLNVWEQMQRDGRHRRWDSKTNTWELP